jgi:hypothetical protein
MHIVEEATVQISPLVSAKIEIVPDDHPEDPRHWDSLGTIKVCESKSEFLSVADDLFGEQEKEAINCMVSGDVFWDDKLTPWLGIERYRHGNDLYALCGAGNFPDRMFDVSPIVGFWSINQDTDKRLLKTLRGFYRAGVIHEAHRRLRERAAADLDIFSRWVNGDVYACVVRITKEDKELDCSSCGGFYAIEDAMGAAREMALLYRVDNHGSN